MGNAVADRYRGYANGSYNFLSWGTKNKATNELVFEKSRLSTEVASYEEIYNQYQDNVSKLSSVSQDFEGFVTNKLKNVKKFLNEGYEGDKSANLNSDLDEYIKTVETCKGNVDELIEEIEARKQEIATKKRNLQNQLSDVRGVLAGVKNATVADPTNYQY